MTATVVILAYQERAGKGAARHSILPSFLVFVRPPPREQSLTLGLACRYFILGRSQGQREGVGRMKQVKEGKPTQGCVVELVASNDNRGSDLLEPSLS